MDTNENMLSLPPENQQADLIDELKEEMKDNLNQNLAGKDDKMRNVSKEEIKQDIDLINPDENTLDRG